VNGEILLQRGYPPIKRVLHMLNCTVAIIYHCFFISSLSAFDSQ
jgi:hypothetical protein